ncbi:translation initiation inhibitor [Paenibacillus vortex V453]|uniref:Translation initiation inhibitor n=2 Tax=Paenibacillus TaxID=44249 RepID=A0A2R9ST16_9BACL|nr:MULTISPECIES: RidA family protein [Paenibacillus]EFU40461.1 translation initiation inhibitor [Paenibacillus vortex V453]
MSLPVSQIVVTSPAKLAFISGQVALNAEGELIGPNDYGQVFMNLKLTIEAAGGSAEHVTQMRIHVVNHGPELANIVFQAGAEVFGSEWPLTASTFLGVQAIAFPEWLIEVDAIVALPQQN